MLMNRFCVGSAVFVLFVLLPLSLGCSSNTADASGGAGSVGSTSETGTAQSTGAIPECAGVPNDDKTGATPVDFKITNKRTTAIYLGGSSDECQYPLSDGTTLTTNLFDLRGPANDAIQFFGRDSTFFCTAEVTRQCACAKLSCAKPAALKIAPNATYTFHWAGTKVDLVPMPTGCSDGCCSMADATLCALESVPPSETLSLSVTPGDQALQCSGSPGCDCTPGASGYCFVDGGAAVGATPVKQTFSYPGTSSVEILIN